jgi:hypothetical protein
MAELAALASSTGAAETVETARTLTMERMEASVNCILKNVERAGRAILKLVDNCVF